MAFTKELQCAYDAASEAGMLQRRRQQSLGEITIKSDESPVTQVDRECEQLIRDKILDAFPNDSFLGEETGCMSGTTARRWIVDPLDGTRPYIRGIPTYSVLIGLEENSVPILGVIHFPALEETYWAQKGKGAFCNNRAIRTSGVTELKNVMGSVCGYYEKSATRKGQCVLSLMKQWDYIYGFMDAYSYASVASGKLDICIGLSDKPWDRAAAMCIVTEAGGAFSDPHGNDTYKNDSVVVTNGVIHQKVIEYFGSAEKGCRVQ